MKTTRKQAISRHKYGVDLKVYKTNNEAIGLVYENTRTGHFEEFYHKKSTFTWYILEGRGNFYLNDKKTGVKATDVIIAPPHTRIYYVGKMKMLLITTPAWQPQHEVHVRDINPKDIKSEIIS